MSQILDSLSQFAHITNRDEQKESNSAWLPTSINKKRNVSSGCTIHIQMFKTIYYTCRTSILKSIQHT